MKLFQLNKKIEIDVILAYLETGFIIARLTDNRHALISMMRADIQISTSPLAFMRGHEIIKDIPKEYIERAIKVINNPNTEVSEYESEPTYPPKKDKDGNYTHVWKEFWEYYDTIPEIRV